MSAVDRKFGVEFEFKGPWSGREHSMYRPRGDMRGFLTENGYGEEWGITHDGSEWEVATPPLQGKHGFKVIKNFCNLLLEKGFSVTSRDGLHVHFDAPEFVGNKELVKRIANLWLQNEIAIHSMVKPERRYSGACPKWSDYDLDRLDTISEREITKGYHNDFWAYRRGGNLTRKDLNLKALGMHGTIEIRLHEGTINYEEVFSWIRFGQNLLDAALNDINFVTQSASELLDKINISRRPKRILSKKAAILSEEY